MPFFDFKCQNKLCHYIFEGFILRYDLPAPACPNCGGQTKRIYTVAISSGDRPPIIPGIYSNDINSDRYWITGKDKINPARRHFQWAHKIENAEIEGRTPRIPGGDGVEKSIAAWKAAGYDL